MGTHVNSVDGLLTPHRWKIDPQDPAEIVDRLTTHFSSQQRGNTNLGK